MNGMYSNQQTTANFLGNNKFASKSIGAGHAYSIPNGPVTVGGGKPPPSNNKTSKKERGKSVKINDPFRPKSRKGLKSGLKMKREASQVDRRAYSN